MAQKNITHVKLHSFLVIFLLNLNLKLNLNKIQQKLIWVNTDVTRMGSRGPPNYIWMWKERTFVFICVLVIMCNLYPCSLLVLVFTGISISLSSVFAGTFAFFIFFYHFVLSKSCLFFYFVVFFQPSSYIILVVTLIFWVVLLDNCCCLFLEFFEICDFFYLIWCPHDIYSNCNLIRDRHDKVGQLSEFLSTISSISFDEANASICFCYGIVYVWTPV